MEGRRRLRALPKTFCRNSTITFTTLNSAMNTIIAALRRSGSLDSIAIRPEIRSRARST